MKRSLYLIGRILLGFFFCALGVILALNSNLGLSPWDVFHQGLSNLTGITIGQASIIVGVVIVIISCLLGQTLGFGTISNMIIIGLFIDFIDNLGIIPVCSNINSGIIMIILSMFSTAIGSYLYIGCGLGCGPRDGLMVIIMKKTNKPVRLIRGIIELSALICGYILGGSVGIGTIITAVGIGYCLQLICNILSFDIDKVRHLNIKESITFIKQYNLDSKVALIKNNRK